MNLVDRAAGDLKPDVPRVDGDRALSESLSKSVLKPLGIPSTQGALQSSTYRAGYTAPQASNPALARFATWASEPGRRLDELDALFRNLAAILAADAFVVPELPELDRPAFVFPRFADLIDRLMAEQSQGAFQQYLFAGLLAEYVDVTITDRRLRVATKPLFQSDKSAGTAGDVDLRAGQNLEAVYEVSANNWRTKLAQAVDALTTRDELSAITVLANEAPTSGSDITAAIVEAGVASGFDPRRLDVAVLNIADECRSLAARLSPRDRAHVVTRLYDYLVQFCRTQPELVTMLVRELQDLGLADAPAFPASQTTTL